MISFIVPAHNEQACLPRTLQAIHDSARAVGQPYEIIVVDDASTDATAKLPASTTRASSASTTANCCHAQFRRTRRARRAPLLHRRRYYRKPARHCLRPSLHGQRSRRRRRSHVLDKNEKVPLYIWVLAIFAVPAAKLIGFTGGAFMFSTRKAFLASGGFNERLYWGEEGSFALRLKREGRFAVVWQPVLTSGRRFRKVSGLQMLAGGLRMIVSPIKMFTQRSLVAKFGMTPIARTTTKCPALSSFGFPTPSHY